MNIELRHLRYFVAVAEEASFSAAARRVHVAQQVLSTQIRQLEAAVGAQLLRRTSRGVVLTPAGAAFLDRAGHAGRAGARGGGRVACGGRGFRQAERRAERGGRRGDADRLLASFASAYPAVELELLTYDLTAPAAGLLDHRTDVALIRPPVDAPGITLDGGGVRATGVRAGRGSSAGRPGHAGAGRRGRAAVGGGGSGC